MKGILAIALAVLTTASAWADRTPSRRANGEKSTGTRTDITVPYLTTGNTNFQGYKTQPKVYSSPTADDPANPGARPAYNLPFYGARMGFGTANNGYIPKPTLLPSQAK